MGIIEQSVPVAKAVAIAAGQQPPMILRARDIQRIFRMGVADIHVLQGVDLAVKQGEFIAIEGRSGSGKSTLLHVLGALDGVDGGQVVYGSTDYTRLTADARRRRFWPPAVLRTATAFRHSYLAVANAPWWMLLGLAVLVATLVLSVLYHPLSRGDLVRNAKPAIFWTVAGGLLLALALPAVFGLLYGLELLARGIGWGCETIFHFGQAGSGRRASRLRNRDFGFVFQFYYLLPELNVLENTVLAPMIEHSAISYFLNRRNLRTRAIQILTDLGMGHRLTHRPDQLSGGERQRVAIARALLNDPKVLLADEPTGNLDADTGKQIMGVLERLHREHGQTIIMVTHDRALARQADRVLVLKEGKLSVAE